MFPMTNPSPAAPSTGGRLVAVDARTLPLVAASLRVDAGGGLARVVLEQRFGNPHDEPLAVTYSLPLPHDAAVSGFAFRVGDRHIVGEIDRRHDARERFEEALVQGHTAALLEEERSTVFTQQIGNVPPRAEVVATITIDQRLAWIDEGAWEWRFPTTVAPRYLGAPGRVPDAERVAQDVADGAMPVRVTFAVTVRDALDGRLPQSPSHPLRAAGPRIEQADAGGVPLDRDVVVRWSVAGTEPGACIETAQGPAGETYALLTLAPPVRAAMRSRVARDLVLLLDVSGSMSGEPLAQCRRVASALVATLDARDSLEMIAFASSPSRWKRGATAATSDAKRDALGWIAGLKASGGTEMRHAIEEALAPMRADAQRQVVVVTDGQIGFESEVVAVIRSRLPKSSRVHVVGVGSAPNRTLTAGAPRAGGGVEVLVGLGEDAERAAARIVARTDAPVVVDLSIGGAALVDHAPSRLPDLFAGAPALIALRVREGDLAIRGRTADGPWEQRVRVPRPEAGAATAIPVLYARERVEDLEMEIASRSDGAHDARAPQPEAEIERLGLAFGIATRATSWIAVSEEPMVDPGEPLRRVRMPHELPHGTSVEGLGLRACARIVAPVLTEMAPARAMAVAGPAIRRKRLAPPPAGPPAPPPAMGSAPPPAPPVPAPKAGILDRLRALVGAGPGGSPTPAERHVTGRVVARTSDGFVIEVAVADALDWSPPARVEITWADGTVTDASVAAERTTRATRLSAGISVRLAVAAAAGASSPVALAFEHGGERWIVTL
jgi:Ca-activated chloride channel family protein